MGLREIKAALRRLEVEGAAPLLILTVPYKRGKAPAERAVMVRAAAKYRGDNAEGIADVRREVKGWVPGVLIRAEAHAQSPVEGQLILLEPTGKGWTYAGDEVSPDPADLRWNDAQIVDDEADLFPLDRWEAAVEGILYGTGRWSRGNMYFVGHMNRPK